MSTKCGTVNKIRNTVWGYLIRWWLQNTALTTETPWTSAMYMALIQNNSWKWQRDNPSSKQGEKRDKLRLFLSTATTCDLPGLGQVLVVSVLGCNSEMWTLMMPTWGSFLGSNCINTHRMPTTMLGVSQVNNNTGDRAPPWTPVMS